MYILCISIERVRTIFKIPCEPGTVEGDEEHGLVRSSLYNAIRHNIDLRGKPSHQEILTDACS
jgi:hypothetical protein